MYPPLITTTTEKNAHFQHLYLTHKGNSTNLLQVAALLPIAFASSQFPPLAAAHCSCIITINATITTASKLIHIMPNTKRQIIALLCIITSISPICRVFAYKENTYYGVDTSFPIHQSFLTGSTSLNATKSIFGNDRIQAYSDFFSG